MAAILPPSNSWARGEPEYRTWVHSDLLTSEDSANVSEEDWGTVSQGQWHVSGDVLTAVEIDYLELGGMTRREIGRDEFQIIEVSNERLVLRYETGGPLMAYDRVEESQVSYIRPFADVLDGP